MKKRKALIILIIFFCISFFIVNNIKAIILKDNIPEDTLYNLHLQVFSGQMTYTFFNKLSKCQKYTSPTDTDFGMALIFPVIVHQKTKILGIENNSCHIANYFSEYFEIPYKLNEYYLPLDFSKELGIFLSNYNKYPQKRRELKREFYSKFKILDNQYSIIFGPGCYKIEKQDTSYIKIRELEEPESLIALNSYIVNNEMLRKKGNCRLITTGGYRGFCAD